MKTKDKLLESYYKGETTLEEEQLLRSLFLQEQKPSAEKEVFSWYHHAAVVPADLETSLLGGIRQQEQKTHGRMRWIYRVSAVAASAVLLIGLFLGIRAGRIRQMENDFFVMERALYQVSESIRPAQEEQMMVLWVDENVEIIIN